MADFPPSAPAANPVFFRTYSRQKAEGRESWAEVCDRTVAGVAQLGQLNSKEEALISRMQQELKALTSGRWLWIGGTDWIAQQKNFSGGYNCTSTNVTDWRAFALMMDLAMMGCGTGAMLEPKYIEKLPAIRNQLNLKVQGGIGATPALKRREETEVIHNGDQVVVHVGDSRQGWVKSYETLLELSSSDRFDGEVEVLVDMSDVRPAGEILKGFGGMANPVKLPDMYARVARILNQAKGRQLNSVECCLLIDEAAVTIVAGNIRRCLPEDALVHTDHGLVPIKEVQIGDRVQTPLGFRKVVDKFDQGFQDVHEIETNGPLPRATLNHRIAIYGDAKGDVVWRSVAELNEGDRLMHNTAILPGTVTSLPEDFTQIRPEQSTTVKPLKIPVLTPDVAWLIGFTHGDGYVALGRNKHDKPYGRVEWAMNAKDVELLPQLREKVDRALKCFGLRASHGVVNGENTAKSVCSSMRLAEYFHRYIKQPNTPLEVPGFVLQGSADVRAAYLAGLMDSDGSAHNRPPHLVTSVYGDFVRQATAVLSSLGIAGRISVTRPQKSHWQLKYNLKLPALKGRYNALIAPHSVKGELRQGLKAHGFTLSGAMMREVYTYSEMRGMGFEGSRTTASNYERYIAESDLSLDIPVTVKGLGSHNHVQTYDIEVEEAHCFYCDGYLTHNSAGMRQFDSRDETAAGAKENLWQQDAEGNWRIDPERDALRMANHTRVFHCKPTKEETLEAVRKQFYSGEGAIQYAPEAIARANADLLHHEDLKKEFLGIYNELGIEEAKNWIKQQQPGMSDAELEHRFQRYGLNPCVTADTWVHTGSGPRQVKDLLGQQHSTYINGELFSTTADGFFHSGTKPVVKLQTQEGQEIRLTSNHQLLKLAAQTPKAQYSDWVEAGELQVGDRILLHNHRDLLPWDGEGTHQEGWLIGSLVADGSLLECSISELSQGELRYWGDTQEDMAAQAISLLNETQFLSEDVVKTQLNPQQDGSLQVSSAKICRLADRYGVGRGKNITAAIEQASYEFYRGFLRGLFDVDASVQGSESREILIRLPYNDRNMLQSAQRMLLRLGINSTIQIRHRAGDRLPVHKRPERQPYFCQTSHELIINNDNILTFADVIGFSEPAKAQRLATLIEEELHQPEAERFTATVAAIVPNGIEDVYDCTVPGPARFDANGFVAHNCGEIIGANFHCVAGETLLITRDGLHAIQDVVGQVVEVWNGQRWSPVVPLKTGEDRQLYRVSFGDGSYLDVTDQHRFFVKDRFGKRYEELTTADLKTALKERKYRLHTEPFTIEYQEGKEIDSVHAYTLGQLVGDGSVCQSNGKPQLQLRLYGAKQYKELTIAGSTTGQKRYYSNNKEVSCLLYVGFQENFDPLQVKAMKSEASALDCIATWNKASILQFIAGLADADGSLTKSGGIRIYLSGYERAYRVYLLLLKCGIRSSINLVSRAGSETNLGIRNYDLWYLQITDCAQIPCQRLDTSRGHQPKAKGKNQIVCSIEPLPEVHDTYCFNEVEFHKGVFGGTLTGQCNLSEIHLNQLNPDNPQEQEDAFRAGALSVAALLNHEFAEERYRQSREWDPIVGVSFTGFFDFCVHAFGSDWLNWWSEGRPETEQGRQFKAKEAEYLNRWREVVHSTIWDYCDRQGLRRPNRCTTTQPAGTKSLLTGASSGWHPPKAQRFIRRITFRKDDPVAMACVDYGYTIVPSQSDKDEDGNLLNDPFDPRCTEWLVEIPTEVSWANLPGADAVDISQFSALAQFDFYMQVQKHYTRHNTSATVELREAEIEPLAERIYGAIESDEGYMSAALLARFDDLQTFPRLPFEPIDKATYDELMAGVLKRRDTDDFLAALRRYDYGPMVEAGPAGCDSDKCLLPEKQPE